MTEPKKRKRRGERADGRILVTLVTGYDSDGRTIRKYFYGKSRAEAEAKRDEYKRKAEQGISADADTITVSQWVDMWMAHYKPNISAGYASGIHAQTKRLNDLYGNRLMSSIREADLQDALYSVSEMSASTITKFRSVLFQIFDKARRNKIIPDNPAEDLIVPSGTRGTHRALERWEMDCIFAHWHEHRAGIWVMLMMLAGLRRGEMMALRWENIDLESRTLTVCESVAIVNNHSIVRQQTKTEAGMRILPICAPLYNALCAFPAASRHGRVCLSYTGAPLTEHAFVRGWQGFNLAMQRALNGEPILQQGRSLRLEDKIEAAHLQGKEYILFSVRSHDMRHTFATALYDAGVPVKAAQYYLGHSDMRMTLELYTHLSKEREHIASTQMVRYLDDWLSKPIEYT